MDDNRKTLIRAVGAEPARLTEASDGKVHVDGLMVPTDVWVEIDSAIEGNFMECVAPGAFTKTIAENGDRIRAIFHHGVDPSIGFKVLGPVTDMADEEGGVRYSIELLPTRYNEDLKPGIAAGQYGTSFKGQVINREFNRRPKRSAHNPKGLPEFRYTEVKLTEFGLTPLPIYGGTTATMRSLMDDEYRAKLADEADRLAATSAAGGFMAPPIGRAMTVDISPGVEISRSRYENILTFVAGTPWAMEPSALAVVLAIISERASGYRPSLDEIRERLGNVERAVPEDDQPASGVHVIPVIGTIIPKANLMTEMSGGTSVTSLQAELRDAVASEDVKSILLRIDSPGGSALGMPELAAEIRAAREVKPVYAVADAIAASAAYFIASSASKVYVTPSGQVGSIGVYTAHDDVSAQQEKLGVKTTLVSAGDYKTEGNPFEPLTDEARADIQEKVDAYYEMFVENVAEGRGVSTETVLAKYGQGRMLMAKDAVRAGMADGVASYDQTLARLEKLSSVKRSKAEPERSVATTRKPEPERSVATTRSPLIWGQSERPDWML